ncbi:MAG: MMPL family transporter [Planctomycetaceae bacterium]
MARGFANLFGWTVDHRGWTVVLIVVLTTAAAIGLFDPRLFSRLLEEPGDTAAAADSRTDGAAREIERLSLTDADAVLVVQSDQFFTPAGADAIRSVVAALVDSPLVNEVIWLEDLPPLNVFGLREPIFPPSSAAPGLFDRAKERALDNPLVVGQLLSPDARTMLLLVKFNWLALADDDEATSGLKEIAEAAVARHDGVSMRVLLTGPTPTYLTYIRSQQANKIKYQIIGYALIGLMAVVLFRGVRAVLIVGIAPMLGTFWTMGLLGFSNIRDNPFNDVVLPILVSLVGLTDGVHLMIEIRRQRATGLNEQDAARAGIGRWARVLPHVAHHRHRVRIPELRPAGAGARLRLELCVRCGPHIPRGHHHDPAGEFVGPGQECPSRA